MPRLVTGWEGDMATREEIREGILRLIHLKNGNQTIIEDDVELCNEIFQYLHSQGVVIKVERELPKDEDYDYYEDEAFDDGQRSMVEAGYVAVEPLIKEKQYVQKK